MRKRSTPQTRDTRPATPVLEPSAPLAPEPAAVPEAPVHDEELADHVAGLLAGGILTAGPERLTAAGIKGVPQVISVGALDMVNFGPPETTPPRYKDRLFYRHNPTVTLMRTTTDEMAKLGDELASKANAATGPTAVLLPLKGVSAIDATGKPFWSPEADTALFGAIRSCLKPDLLIERNEHINDPAFAEACATKLIEMMRNP